MIATAVELIFDRQLTNTIVEIWERFTAEHLQYRHHPRQAQPHITLAIRELSGDATDALHALANKLTQFVVSFGAAGIFLRPRGLNHPDDSVVLFLSPTPSQALLEAHRVATEELSGWNQGKWAHYGPEQWVPHCTLAEHLAKPDVSKALQVCGDQLDWPVTGRVYGLRLVNVGLGEMEELASLTLPRRAL